MPHNKILLRHPCRLKKYLYIHICVYISKYVSDGCALMNREAFSNSFPIRDPDRVRSILNTCSRFSLLSPVTIRRVRNDEYETPSVNRTSCHFAFIDNESRDQDWSRSPMRA